MRNLFYALASLGLLATQAVGHIVPTTALAAYQPVNTGDKTNYTLTLNTKSTAALQLVDQRPNFDTEVLSPLRTKQAARVVEEAAAAARASAAAKKAKAKVTATTASVHIASGDVWEALRMCEAGGNYANKNNPRYRGAYQYSFSTWGNYAGFYDPADAPPAVQDAKAHETQAARGWSPWPACARKLGLL